jgi:glycosyltransferase involved in cell wall biosynthesis
MEAMIDRIVDDQEVDLVVVNVDNIKSIRRIEVNGVCYYTIPGKNNNKYDYKSLQVRSYWKNIFEKEKPDLIELWGTEMPIGIPALDVAGDKPAVVYVQGILESIGKYYTAGLSIKELKKARSFRDLMTRSTIYQCQKAYLKRARLEAQIISRCKNIIIENKWAEAYYKKSCPEVAVHWCPLSISSAFGEVRWSLDKVNLHTLMCPAANYPIKGLHMLLKAIAIMKSKYPEVKLTIPGTPLKDKMSFKERLKQSGYDKFIRNQIKQLGLADIVQYTGRLTASEMAKRMSECHVFVMSSAIENHSSTLKEAMTVGVPCVSSYVGGVPEYAKHEENCLLFRYEDYEVMAQEIIRLFESDDLCQHLSQNAAMRMQELREHNDFYEISKKIYQTIIKNGK